MTKQEREASFDHAVADVDALYDTWLPHAEVVAAKPKSDELRSIGSFSVLSEPDRRIVQAAARWLRHMWLEATPGSSLRLDGIENEEVYNLMRQVEDLANRTAGENQLIQRPDNARERAHASDHEGVCLGCGGRTVNGTCLRNCDRD